MNNTGLYIHIPFCRARCKYCDFCSCLKSIDYQKQYVGALRREIGHISRVYPQLRVDTIYVGGGTPSALYEGGLSEIFECIHQHFSLEDDSEITIEANPESVGDRLREFEEVGANRISLGVQSLSDETLRLIGRIHSRDKAIQAIEDTLSTFANVNVDVMLGLPNESIADTLSTVETLMRYPLRHVSAYSLKLERGTPMYREKNTLNFASMDEQADCYDEVRGILSSHGLDRYEVSNFAIDGYESKHNLRYWRRLDYIGLGASAHSAIGDTRYHHSANIDAYISNPVRRYKSVLTAEDVISEYIMLGFRTREGVSLSKLEDMGVDISKTHARAIAKWKDCLEVREDSISIKDEYLYCMNQIVVDFI